ncbi:hypothetical protein, partial [Pseudomonas aeruginosa]
RFSMLFSRRSSRPRGLAAVLLALFAAGAVRQSVVNRRPMENRS